MRIIAGKFKGKNLEFRKRRGLRATSQKVKEAMFSILGNLSEEIELLDLYCGYGTLGIEAISRGAGKVVFVDVDGNSLKQLDYFLDNLGIKDQAKIIKRDAIKTIKHFSENQFDLIIMDPPYHVHFEEKTLTAIDKYKVLKPDGICVVEHFTQNPIPDRIGSLIKYKEKVYGDTTLSMYQRKLTVNGVELTVKVEKTVESADNEENEGTEEGD